MSGGGSIVEKDEIGFVGIAGSGNDGMSSAVRVSIDISLVSAVDERSW